MELTLLGAISFWKHFLAVIFIIVCALMVVLVLLQKGRGGGLASAFGGAGGQSAFGSKTGDTFTKITIGFAVIFLVLAVLVSKFYTPSATIQEAPQQISQPLTSQDVGVAPTEETASAEIATETPAEDN